MLSSEKLILKISPFSFCKISIKIIKFWNLLTSSKFRTVFSCISLNKKMHLLPLFLPSTPKANTITRPDLLDVPLARTNKYGKESVKYQCVRDWNNFKKKFPQIPENKQSYMKIKRILKQAIFDQYWPFLFTIINYYMCTLYYFYFLSSRVIQLKPSRAAIAFFK